MPLLVPSSPSRLLVLRVVTRRDGGRTFVYQSAIANATHYPDSGEGPNEHALTYLKDGSTILCILRAYGDGRCGSTGCETRPLESVFILRASR